MWRWTGFNLGLDLIVTYDRHCLSLKRNQVCCTSTFFCRFEMLRHTLSHISTILDIMLSLEARDWGGNCLTDWRVGLKLL